MKITAEGILGSAQKINNQRKLNENSDKSKADIKTDSLSLGKALNSRIESIEREIKEIQTSLTKNQIIREGIDNLSKNTSPEAMAEILQKTTYNGQKILQDFLGKDITPSLLMSKREEIQKLINEDVNSLTRIQVETDNIAASNLASGKKFESLVKNVNDIFKDASLNSGAISNLDADKVMRLIK